MNIECGILWQWFAFQFVTEVIQIYHGQYKESWSMYIGNIYDFTLIKNWAF